MIEVPKEGRQTQPTTGEDLLDIDGNAFMVLGKTSNLLRKAGATKEFVEAFRAEAISGDYDHVIATALAYLDAEPLG